MCGLFGIHTDHLTPEESARLFGLGILSMTRGTDSSGVCVVQEVKGKLRTRERREVLPMHQFLMKDNIRTLLADARARAVLGHARAATIGNITVHNAHPIHEKQIIGTHNGTIDHFKPDKDSENISSDSRVLFRKLAEKGVEEALGEANEKDGAFALAWVDLSNQTLNFARNFKRTLFILESQHTGVFYWASDDKFFDVLIKNDKPSLFKKPYPLRPGFHYSIKIGHNEELTFNEIKSMRWVSTGRSVSAITTAASTTTTTTTKSESKSSTTSAKTGPATMRIHQPPWTTEWEDELEQGWYERLQREEDEFADNYGRALVYKCGTHGYIDTYRARQLLKCGCTLCSADCDLTDEVFWFMSEQSFVCRDCVDDPMVTQYGALDKLRTRGILVRRGADCH